MFTLAQTVFSKKGVQWVSIIFNKCESLIILISNQTFTPFHAMSATFNIAMRHHWLGSQPEGSGS